MNTTWILLTNACNLDCKYCYIKDDGKNGNKDNIERILKLTFATKSMKSHRFVFFGGEPLLRLDLLRFSVPLARDFAREYGKEVEFSLYTNGTLLTKKAVDELEKLGIRVNVSLDGTKESQDQDRLFKNGNSSYPSVVKNIPYFLKKNPNGMVHGCISPKNVHELSRNLQHYYDLGFKRVYFHLIHSSDWSETAVAAFKKGLDSVFSWSKLHPDMWINLVDDSIKKIDIDSASPRPCDAGVMNFAFSVDG